MGSPAIATYTNARASWCWHAEMRLKLSDQWNKSRAQAAVRVMLVYAMGGARFIALDYALNVSCIRICLVLTGEHWTDPDKVVLPQEFCHLAKLKAIAGPG